jgi:hypothetical protein
MSAGGHDSYSISGVSENQWLTRFVPLAFATWLAVT